MMSVHVFTLLSIKTRIETDQSRLALKVSIGFLLYYPLKQGLKLIRITTSHSYIWFLLYYPLKQGLKHPMDDIGVDKQLCFYSTIH